MQGIFFNPDHCGPVNDVQKVQRKAVARKYLEEIKVCLVSAFLPWYSRRVIFFVCRLAIRSRRGLILSLNLGYEPTIEGDSCHWVGLHN